MITVTLVVLAAIFFAVSHTLLHHFDSSVFKNKNYKVWDADRSEVKPFWVTGYKPDPWHISNSFALVCLICAIVFNDLNFAWYWEVIGLGIIYNIVFGLFYTHILRRK